MRHFERYDSIDYFTELNDMGKNNAKDKITYLEKLNINLIFCSPFIRTIQSIEPYCQKNNIFINIENSLYEYANPKYFNKDNYKHSIKELKKYNSTNIINNNYDSYLKLDNLEFPSVSCDIDIKGRTSKFISYLYKKYKSQNVNILLITHKSTINAILNRDLEESYDLGKINEINFV